jgi:chromosome condensin MukBEF ATPase and DNA-binding subunit MukB
MSSKLSAEQIKQADSLLSRLDKVASDIQANHKSWGMSFEAAKSLVNGLDKVADDLETSIFGSESLVARQREVVAKVIQKDSDEKYMDTFNKPTAPIQTDADEPYMSAYADDQSSAVNGGKSTTGRPLAP